MGGQLRVAIIQPKPVNNDPSDKGNPGKASELILQASESSPDIIVFPEYFPFHETNELRETVASSGAYVVAGIAYREGGTIYNTATVYAPDGSVVLRQRKRYVGRLESRLWGFTGWNGPYYILDIGKARLGIAVCADFWSIPESSLELFLGGADLFINPAYMFSLQGHWITANLSRALDFFTPVVGADMARFPLKTKRYTFTGGGLSHVIMPPNNQDEYLNWWASGAVDVTGWIRVKLPGNEAITYYDIDVAEVNELRKDWWKRMRGYSIDEWRSMMRTRHEAARIIKV